nr:retrovirus-related Pol polyprotein from transposon TNT 1-94 [Tanacetum cinerariifolium]
LFLVLVLEGIVTRQFRGHGLEGALDNHGCSFNGTWADIGTRNTAYLRDLLMEISQIDISVDEDTCTWSLADDGIFSVRSARRLIDSKLLSSIKASTLWDKILPRKMTTFVVTNLVFNGFFEKQRLTRPNFMDWYRQLKIVLSVEDKLDYLDKQIPSAPIPAQAGQQVALEALAAHTAWVKGSKEIARLMLMTMEPDIQQNLENLSAYDMLQELKTLFAQQQSRNFFRLGQNQGTGKNKLAYAPKPKISPPPKREDHAKDSVCHQCGDTGHWKRNCPQYLAELLRNKKLSQGASVSVFQKEVENQLGKTIKSLRSDRGGEKEKQNPTRYGSIHDASNNSSKVLWDYALETAACILNMVPTKKVEKTPYKVWRGQAPKLSYLKVWGCEALVKRDTLTKPNKLEPRSIKCIFIGYQKETMGYSFYYPPENKVLVARNAEFLKNILITQEASGSLEDLEIIQEEDTHPFIDTSLNHEEDNLEIDEPQSDIIPIRRSARTRHAADRMCLYIDAGEHELGNLGEPANYKAALLDPESNKWLDAINVEMQSIKDNEVWDLVELPPNGKTVGSKWLLKKKTDMDGAVHTFKARLVAKGFTQTYGVDYEETFAPAADIRAIRILIAIVVYYDYEIWQMDVKIAFLNGHLLEEVYMEEPEGFVNPNIQTEYAS